MQSTQSRGSAGINACHLKLIAIFGMTLDHIGVAFGAYLSLPVKTALYALGGLTFPIMAFFITEGFRHTSNINRYIMRLLGFAMISVVPYVWGVKLPILNVLFTLTLGLVTLRLHQTMKNRAAFWFAFAGICFATVIMDCGIIGVPMILLYHTLEGKRGRFVIPALILIGYVTLSSVIALFITDVSVLILLPDLALAYVGCSLTIPLLSRYNGKRDEGVKLPKYLFHIYYPAHLLVLAIVRGLVFNDWALALL